MKLQPHQSGTLEYTEVKCPNQHGLLVFHNMGTGKTITGVSWLINRKVQYKSQSPKPKQKPKTKPKHHSTHRKPAQKSAKKTHVNESKNGHDQKIHRNGV